MYRRIRDLREDHDLKQSEVAKIINTTQQQYSKIENGKSEITADKLIQLSILYRTTTDYILGLTDNPQKNKR